MNEGYSHFGWRLDIQNTDTQHKGLSINYNITTLTIVCHHAECRIFKLYAECHQDECRYSECFYAECHYADRYYDEYRYAECVYAECRPAECCYA